MSLESVFISYSEKDLLFALDLAKNLKHAGANIWIEYLDLQPGDDVEDASAEAIETSKWVMVMLSSNSIMDENVKDEVRHAKDNGKEVISVIMEKCQMPLLFKNKEYADFSEDKAIGLEILYNKIGVSQDVVSLSTGETESVKEKNANKDSIELEENSQKKEFSNEEANLKESLLMSDEDFEAARRTFKNRIRDSYVAITVLIAASVGLFIFLHLSGLLEGIMNGEFSWLSNIGASLPALLSPYSISKINEKKRRIELINQFQRKRNRMKKVLFKLSEEKIIEFEEEFTNLISV